MKYIWKTDTGQDSGAGVSGGDSAGLISAHAACSVRPGVSLHYVDALFIHQRGLRDGPDRRGHGGHLRLLARRWWPR